MMVPYTKVRTVSITLILEGQHTPLELHTEAHTSNRKGIVNMLTEGFYWIKHKPGGRWEVAEYDGVSWNIEDPIYIIGPRIAEPTH